MKAVTFENEMAVIKCTPNALVLDRCDYYFDGELQEQDGYVLNITERANALERPVDIHQDYYFTVREIPDSISLVCETPEQFTITINGQLLTAEPKGYFRDKSFRCIDIKEHVQMGKNTISFDCHFEQSKEVYESLKKAAVFESEKNKLSYDMEIEAVYLIGDFGVNTPGEWKELPKDADRYCGVFEIDKRPDKLIPKDLHKKGFPFFSGSITLSGKIDVGEKSVLKLERRGVNVVKVEMADEERLFLWNGDEISLEGWGKPGENDIIITITNNLRNLLGPHHLEEGESYEVGPANFFKEKCVWSYGVQTWNDSYCFVKFGV